MRLRKAGKNADQHITLPGEGKKKEWLNIAERIQAGRGECVFHVPQFLESGRYLLRVSARPRSQVNHIRSEAYVTIVDDASEYATSMLQMFDPSLEAIPIEQQRTRLQVDCGSAGVLPIHFFAILCKHVYESSEKAKNATRPEECPFWERLNKLSSASYFPADADASEWCSVQRKQCPALEQTRGLESVCEGFGLVETYVQSLMGGMVQGLKAQVWKRSADPEKPERGGTVFVVVFRGTSGTMDYLVCRSPFCISIRVFDTTP